MKKQLPVIPKPEDLNRLKNLQLIARWTVEGFISGLHRSPYHGYSAEFLQYRQYNQGDDLKNVDWKVYGRTDRAYIKQFQSETNLRVYLLLDTSRSMSCTFAGRDKFVYARSLAASLVYLFQRQGDAAGLVTFSDGVHSFRKPASGPLHRQALFSFLEEIKAAGKSGFKPVLDELSERISGRSLVVLISDFYTDPEALKEGLRHLRFKRHEVVAFHLLDPVEESLELDGLFNMIDLETGGRLQVDAALVRESYCRKFREHMQRLQTVCNDSNVEYHVMRTGEPFAEALAAYLNVRMQLRR